MWHGGNDLHGKVSFFFVRIDIPSSLSCHMAAAVKYPYWHINMLKVTFFQIVAMRA